MRVREVEVSKTLSCFRFIFEFLLSGCILLVKM